MKKVATLFNLLVVVVLCAYGSDEGKVPHKERYLYEHVNKYVFKISIKGDNGTFDVSGFKIKYMNGIVAPLHSFYRSVSVADNDLSGYKVTKVVSIFTNEILFDDSIHPLHVTKVDMDKDLCLVNFGFKKNLLDLYRFKEGFVVADLDATNITINDQPKSGELRVVNKPQLNGVESLDFKLNGYTPYLMIADKIPPLSNNSPSLDQDAFFIPGPLKASNDGVPVVSKFTPEQIIGVVGYVKPVAENNQRFYGIALSGLKLVKPDAAVVKSIQQAHKFGTFEIQSNGIAEKCGDHKSKQEAAEQFSTASFWINFKHMNCVFLNAIHSQQSNPLDKDVFGQIWEFYSYAFWPQSFHSTHAGDINTESKKSYPLLMQLMAVHAFGDQVYLKKGGEGFKNNLVEAVKKLDTLLTDQQTTAEEANIWGGAAKVVKDAQDIYNFYSERMGLEKVKDPLKNMPTLEDKVQYIMNSSVGHNEEKKGIVTEVVKNELKDFAVYIKERQKLRDDIFNLDSAKAVNDIMTAIIKQPLLEDGYRQLDSLKLRWRSPHVFDSVITRFEEFKEAFKQAFILNALKDSRAFPKATYKYADRVIGINISDSFSIKIWTGKQDNEFLNVAYRPYPVSQYNPPQAQLIAEMLDSYIRHTQRLFKNVVSNLHFNLMAVGHADGIPFTKPWPYKPNFPSIDLNQETFTDLGTGKKIWYKNAINAPDKNLALAYLRALYPLAKSISSNPELNRRKFIYAMWHDDSDFSGKNRYLNITITTEFDRAQ